MSFFFFFPHDFFMCNLLGIVFLNYLCNMMLKMILINMTNDGKQNKNSTFLNLEMRMKV